MHQEAPARRPQPAYSQVSNDRQEGAGEPAGACPHPGMCQVPLHNAFNAAGVSDRRTRLPAIVWDGCDA